MDQAEFRLFDRMREALEKIAEKDFGVKAESGSNVVVVPTSHTPEGNLSTWRVAALKRIEKACEMIDTLIKNGNLAADEIIVEDNNNNDLLENLEAVKDSGGTIIVTPLSDLINIRRTLMENNFKC